MAAFSLLLLLLLFCALDVLLFSSLLRLLFTTGVVFAAPESGANVGWVKLGAFETGRGTASIGDRFRAQKTRPE